jgi:heme/copper-type cytochrome/quinol oxidase subunit 2
MYWGWIFAFLTGVGLPAVFIIFGDSMEALGSPTKTPEENFQDMLSITTWMFVIGGIVWILAFAY